MVKAPSSHLLLSPSPACLLRAIQGSPRCPAPGIGAAEAISCHLCSCCLYPPLAPRPVRTLTNRDGDGSFYPPAIDKPKKVGPWGSEVFGG